MRRAYVNRYSAGGVLYDKGRVLLIESESRHSIDWPKGTIEQGETHEQAAIREVMEETGYKTTIVAPLETITYQYQLKDGRECRKTVHLFILKRADTLPPRPNREPNEDFHNLWVTLEEARDLLTYESSRRAVVSFMKHFQTNYA